MLLENFVRPLYYKNWLFSKLQVQCDHYETHFKPSLSSLGYNGVFKKRTGDKQDGCAIFFKSGRLELVDTVCWEHIWIKISGSLKNTSAIEFHAWRYKIR